jgi:hypothetical protein
MKDLLFILYQVNKVLDSVLLSASVLRRRLTFSVMASSESEI